MTGNFAERLRAVRARSGRTLRELQSATFVSDSALSRYFSGQSVPPWTVVVAICELGRVDPADLHPAWLAARGGRRGGSATREPARMHAELSRDLSTITEAVDAAIRSVRDLGAPVSEHLLTARHAAADATRRLGANQPGSNRISASTDGGTK